MPVLLVEQGKVERALGQLARPVDAAEAHEQALARGVCRPERR